MAGLFDSHTHINNEAFEEDLDEICTRLRENGVEYIMNVGWDLESSVKAFEQACEYEWCYCAAGCHPHEVEKMSDAVLEELKQLAQKPKVMAVGEIGLDYHYDNSPRELQREWFRKQIRMAKEINKPIIIHSRDAHEDTMEILKDEKAFETGVLMHCFSGSAELAEQYIKLGAMISISGTVTYKNSRKQKEVVQRIPLKYLMVETDAPYLTPVPFRGRRNEPSYVRFTASTIAALLGKDDSEIIEATNENARAFFGI